MRPPSTPTTAGRSRSSIRPVARTSDVDFDKIPSPRPLNSTQRSSRNAGPGPSSLSKSIRARESTPDDPQDDEEGHYDYQEDDMGNGFGDYGPQETPPDPDSSPKRGRGRPKSFSRIEEDDEEQDEEQEPEEEEDPGPGRRSSRRPGPSSRRCRLGHPTRR